MKILAFIVMLLAAGTARAQSDPQLYRALSPTFTMSFTSGPQVAGSALHSLYASNTVFSTGGQASFMCTVSCWMNFLLSSYTLSFINTTTGQFVTPAVANAVGILLPPLTQRNFYIPHNGKFTVIGDSASGFINVIILSR